MREFLQVDDNLFVIPMEVAAVKRGEGDICSLYVKGVAEPFTVARNAVEVIGEMEEDFEGADGAV